MADKAVELMVVATPSNLHAEQTIAALRAGQHVIVEKPMASDLAGADAMIAVAEETGRILTVHQNLRYAADFVKMREVIASGVLGRIIEIRIHNGGFDRRWDWQTLKRYGGGALNNSGPHFIDMGMLLIDDPEPTVFCHMEATPLYAGDADSHVKVVLKPKRGPLVEINITAACAYPQPNFLVLGTQGSLVCDRGEAVWKYFDPAEAPALILDDAPIARDRTYNREQLPWKEERAPDRPRRRARYRDALPLALRRDPRGRRVGHSPRERPCPDRRPGEVPRTQSRRLSAERSVCPSHIDYSQSVLPTRGE